MLIDNHFEIIKQFGAGGLGVVSRCGHPCSGRHIIVKQSHVGGILDVEISRDRRAGATVGLRPRLPIGPGLKANS